MSELVALGSLIAIIVMGLMAGPKGWLILIFFGACFYGALKILEGSDTSSKE